MMIGPDALGVQALLESDGGRLPGPAGEDDGTDVQADPAEGIDQAQGVLVVSDAQVAADLAGLDIIGVDRDEDLFLVLHFQEHLHLAVRLETRQDAARMVVVEELAAQFQVELAAKLVDPLHDALGLHARILIVIKADFHILNPRDPESNKGYFTLAHGTWSRFPRRKYKKRQGYREPGLAFPAGKRYTLPCRLRDEDWVPCDPSV